MIPARRLACALATVAALGVVAAPAGATTVLEVDVDQMSLTSEWVVRATVLAVTPVDLREQGKALFTDVTIAPTEIYKGEGVPTTYTLRLLGGTGADGTSLWIPGMPKFQVGEDVVLFLERTSAGHIPCGLGQGVWRLGADSQGEVWARQSDVGAHVLRRAADGRLVEAPERLVTGARLLDELVADVYATLIR